MTNLSAPNVSLSKKTFGPRPKDRYSPRFTYLGYDGTSIPKFLDQPLSDGAVGGRALYGKRAAETQQGSLGRRELVALGVSAEVIMIVENQDPRF